MRINFVQRENGPERLVCEAEVVFEEGVDSEHLAGLKLVGFSLWRAPDAEIYVTFPSRAFGGGNDRKYFDFLRSTEGAPADAKRLKVAIIKAWHSVSDGTHEPPEQDRARQEPSQLAQAKPLPEPPMPKPSKPKRSRKPKASTQGRLTDDNGSAI